MKFLKYFLVGAVCSNIPWLGWGMIFGFRAFLATAILLSIFHKQSARASKTEMGLVTLTLSIAVTALDTAIYSAIQSDFSLSLVASFVGIALPSILLASIVTGLLHKKTMFDSYEEVRCTCKYYRQFSGSWTQIFDKDCKADHAKIRDRLEEI